MKVLLLGVGMQGKAALHDLAQRDVVTGIVAADREFEGLERYLATRPYGAKVRCEHLDAARGEDIDRLLAEGPDVVLSLLPVLYHGAVAAAAVKYGVHMVDASYAAADLIALSDRARERGVTILPEFGMDPGIDLVLLGEAVRRLDRVESIVSYGAGFPEPDAANNPLKYKVTWSMEGVLKSYFREARIIRDGKTVRIGKREMFNPEHTHEVNIEGLGKLEAFPNGDALDFLDLLGIDASGLRTMGRYVLRWPGHCAFWKALVDLGLLDDEPVTVDGKDVDRKRFLAAILEPRLRNEPNERDVVVARVEVAGSMGRQRKRVVYQAIDRRDLETGFTAMSRTVGYTASIGAMMIGTGQISKRGLLSPVNDVPYEFMKREWEKRGINISSESSAPGD